MKAVESLLDTGDAGRTNSMRSELCPFAEAAALEWNEVASRATQRPYIQHRIKDEAGPDNPCIPAPTLLQCESSKRLPRVDKPGIRSAVCSVRLMLSIAISNEERPSPSCHERSHICDACIS